MSVVDLMRRSNPWWEGDAASHRSGFKDKRYCFSLLEHEALASNHRQSVVLRGHRRVGKTVALKQLVEVAISEGHFPAGNVCFVDMVGLHPEHRPMDIVDEFMAQRSGTGKPCLFLFDDIQSCMDWEKDIKVLTDHVKGATIVVAQSIASVLKRQSVETGLGRFQKILMPPVSFCEFLEFRGWPINLPKDPKELREERLGEPDIARLNDLFVEYINRGGYPKAIFDEDAAKDPALGINHRAEDYYGSHTHLYGIADNDRLFKLLLYIAKNNGKELKPSQIIKDTGINTHTLAKYFKFLKAAFLVRKIDRRGIGLQNFQRKHGTKYILENPCMQRMLTGVAITEDDCPEHVAGAAITAQHQASIARHKNTFRPVCYSRYKHNGKAYGADMMEITLTDELVQLANFKWTDSKAELDEAKRNLEHVLGNFSTDEEFEGMYCTTKSSYFGHAESTKGDHQVRFIPAAQFCLALGLDARTLVTHDGHGVQKHSRVQPVQSKPS